MNFSPSTFLLASESEMSFQMSFQGFFRRTISNQLAYRQCPKNGTCKILRMNRNRCQFCRFKKCMEVGMSRDSVKYGRIPKKQKARMIQDRKEQWWDQHFKSDIWPFHWLGWIPRNFKILVFNLNSPFLRENHKIFTYSTYNRSEP